MPKINLAQEALRNQVIGRRRRILYAASAVILLVVLSGYGTPWFLERQAREEAAREQEAVNRLQAQLDARRDDVQRIVLFRERLRSLGTVLGGHIRWSGVLDELERLTVPTATITGLKGAVADRVLKTEVLVPTVDAAADLIASFQDLKEKNPTRFLEARLVGLRVAEGAAAEAVGRGYALSLQLVGSAEVFRGQPAPSPAPVVVPAPGGPTGPEV